MAAGGYDPEFYDAIRDGALRSARRVVPLVVELLRPRSVIDVGCGEGLWLSAFRENGVADVLGIDGPHVCRDQLHIPHELFRQVDLAQPFSSPRSFDLAISLEVGEHLPHSSAPGFVASLARCAPAVLFSAAIPLQGGTNHLNEQWPEYWAAHFATHRYVPIDCIRPRVWLDGEVEWWYQQNMILYAHEQEVRRSRRLFTARSTSMHQPLSLVHPDAYLEAAQAERQGVAPFCKRERSSSA